MPSPLTGGVVWETSFTVCPTLTAEASEAGDAEEPTETPEASAEEPAEEPIAETTGVVAEAAVEEPVAEPAPAEAAADADAVEVVTEDSPESEDTESVA